MPNIPVFSVFSTYKHQYNFAMKLIYCTVRHIQFNGNSGRTTDSHIYSILQKNHGQKNPGVFLWIVTHIWFHKLCMLPLQAFPLSPHIFIYIL